VDKESLTAEKLLTSFKSSYGEWKKGFDKDEFEDYEIDSMLKGLKAL